MTPARIARFLGLFGLAAFLGLAARTSTATPAIEDDPPLPSPPGQFGPAFDEPLVVPPPTTIPPPPALESAPKPKPNDKTKPAKDKEVAPEIVPAPVAPVDPTDDELAPLPLDDGDNGVPVIAPAPELPSVDPPKASRPVMDDLLPAPVRVEPRKAWRAEREGSSGRMPVPVEIAVEVDEVATIASDDPDAQARSFVERNQREAEARLKALGDEAEGLRARLAKVETAIAQWQALADAMKRAQDAAVVKPEAPQAKPSAAEPEASAPLQEPRAARAQDVPAPPLR